MPAIGRVTSLGQENFSKGHDWCIMVAFRNRDGHGAVVEVLIEHTRSSVLQESPTLMECDVIVVNYNAGELLVECVRSAFNSGASRVIVVDNASQDGSMERLRKAIAHPQLILIQNATNVGFARGCNIGINASTAPILMFLNPDSTIEPSGLTHLHEVLMSSPNIGMVGGLLSNLDGSEQAGGRRVFPTPRRAFIRAFGLSRLAQLYPRLFTDFLLHREPLPSHPVEVEAISGACMMVKRDALTAVGLWDEDYFMHCEDLDLCMRFKLGDWRVLFVPDARVIHDRGACSRSRPVRVEWYKHKGMLRFYRKFFRHKYPGILMLLVTLGVWIRFLAISLYLTKKRVRFTGRTQQ